MPNINMEITRDLRASNAYRIICRNPKGILVVKSYNSQMKKFIVGFTTEVNNTGTQVSFGKKTDALAFLDKVKEDTAVLTRKYTVDTNNLELFHGRGTTQYKYRLVMTQYGPCYIKAYAYAELLKKYYPRTLFETDMKNMLPDYYFDFGVSEKQLMIWAWDFALRENIWTPRGVSRLNLIDQSEEGVAAARKYFTKERIQKLINDKVFKLIHDHIKVIEDLSDKITTVCKPLVKQTMDVCKKATSYLPSKFDDSSWVHLNEISLSETKAVADHLNFFWKTFVKLQPEENKDPLEYLKTNFIPEALVDPVITELSKLFDKCEEERKILKDELAIYEHTYNRFKIETEYGELEVDSDINAPIKNCLEVIYAFWDDVNWFKERATDDKAVVALNFISYFFANTSVLGTYLGEQSQFFNMTACQLNNVFKDVDMKQISNEHPEVDYRDLNELILHGDDLGVETDNIRFPGLSKLKRMFERWLDDNEAGQKLEDWDKTSLLRCYVVKERLERLTGESFFQTEFDIIKTFIDQKYNQIVNGRRDYEKRVDTLPYSTTDNFLVDIPNSEGDFNKRWTSASWRQTADRPKTTTWTSSKKPEWDKDSNRNRELKNTDSWRQIASRSYDPIMFNPNKNISYQELYDKWINDEIGLIDLVNDYSLSLNEIYNASVDPYSAYTFFKTVHETYKNRKVRNLMNKVNTDKFKNLPTGRKNKQMNIV